MRVEITSFNFQFYFTPVCLHSWQTPKKESAAESREDLNDFTSNLAGDSGYLIMISTEASPYWRFGCDAYHLNLTNLHHQGCVHRGHSDDVCQPAESRCHVQDFKVVIVCFNFRRSACEAGGEVWLPCPRFIHWCWNCIFCFLSFISLSQFVTSQQAST
jgi:hypothetical protein